MALTQTVGERTYNYSHCMAYFQAWAAPVDLALGGDGNLYVASRGFDVPNGVFGFKEWVKWDMENDRRIGEGGSYGRGDGQFIWPASIALDKTGLVYVSDEHLDRISVYSSDGKFQCQWGVSGCNKGSLGGPAGIRFDLDGNLFVAESRNNRIQKFTKDGESLLVWGDGGGREGEFSLPYGIHVDRHGDVFVADWGNDRVQKFSGDGKFLCQFGVSGDGVGELRRPTSVATDRDGDVYVVDWGNNRVQIFDPYGEAITSLHGDARELSKAAAAQVNANPDLLKARRRADITQEWTFRRATAVETDNENKIYVMEAISGRVQVYQKEEDYTEAQFNL